MIDACSLRLLDWIQDAEGNRHPVTSMLPEKGGYSRLRHRWAGSWLINGKPEAHWFGIPLTLEFLQELEFELQEDEDWINAVKDSQGPLHYEELYYSKKEHEGWSSGQFLIVQNHKNKAVLARLEFLHELQQWHLSITGKHLQLNLWRSYTS